MVLTSGIKS
jgi:hypothetical protein